MIGLPQAPPPILHSEVFLLFLGLRYLKFEQILKINWSPIFARVIISPNSLKFLKTIIKYGKISVSVSVHFFYYMCPARRGAAKRALDFSVGERAADRDEHDVIVAPWHVLWEQRKVFVVIGVFLM